MANRAIDPLGYGALVLAAMTWAAYSVRFRTSRLSALQSAALICFWSAVIFIPVYVGWNLSRLNQASSQEIVFRLVYQGVLMSGVALFAYNRAIAALGAGAAAAMMALVPVLATLLAMPVLGEAPSLLGVAAIIVIAIGVVVAARRPLPVAVLQAAK
ncbi:EamA family transporter [Bordetella petrii]|uniref:EamA family transporter n=1 Tax=Bordetella petrii TaxID=94624 RepID=UPI000686D94D|nr:EamA family transporter [Bordetella petrii]